MGSSMAPPFINATGLVTKTFNKIIEAQQPERFTQDFLSTKLGLTGGSARPIIPLLKRLGFVASDGTPTALYSQFRNPDTRGAAMAQAMRIGYKDLFERNEYANDLTKEKLKNLIVELTGAAPDDGMVRSIVGTFTNLLAYARFDQKLATGVATADAPVPPTSSESTTGSEMRNGVGRLNLAYTINLNLPETSDVEVFNAIFKSLKEHLLKG